MTRTTFTIAIVVLCSTAAAAPLVTFELPCECLDNHGKQRWAEKNDPAQPPTDASAIQSCGTVRHIQLARPNGTFVSEFSTHRGRTKMVCTERVV
jgi:hypothetical protein